jgi:NADH-quinone oxidoreductase subunit M
VLLGAYRVNVWFAAVAALGLVTAVVYALALVQKTFHGENTQGWRLHDSSARETATLAALIVLSVWLGLYPQPVLDLATPATDGLQRLAGSAFRTGVK